MISTLLYYDTYKKQSQRKGKTMNSPTILKTRVFCKILGGNPCPVVMDADNLSTEEMQKMTKDFGHESVFILNEENSKSDFQFRYFVPHHEMEMCVHATVAAIKALVIYKNITKTNLLIETRLGVVPVNWELIRGEIVVEVAQFLPIFNNHVPSHKEVAKALGTDESNIDLSLGPIQSVSTSREKMIVPLKDIHILNTLQPNYEYLWDLCDHYNTTGFYPFVMNTKDSTTDVEARQFPKRAGYNEDPATGLAACALGCYLIKHQVLKKTVETGVQEFKVGQGVAINEPSVIDVKIEMQENHFVKTSIRGMAMITADPRLIKQE